MLALEPQHSTADAIEAGGRKCRGRDRRSCLLIGALTLLLPGALRLEGSWYPAAPGSMEERTLPGSVSSSLATSVRLPSCGRGRMEAPKWFRGRAAKPSGDIEALRTDAAMRSTPLRHYSPNGTPPYPLCFPRHERQALLHLGDEAPKAGAALSEERRLRDDARDSHSVPGLRRLAAAGGSPK